MTEFKKTLQNGTPGAAAYPMVTPKAAQPQAPIPPAQAPVPVYRPPVVPANPNPYPPPSSVSPASSQQGYPQHAPRPVMGSMPEMPPSSGATNLPPPPADDELRRSRPPQGHRTPSATRQAPSFGSPMPEGAPGWMLRARRMSLALEEAIKTGGSAAGIEACIERAWAAWELDGSSDKQIARIARLIEKAHTAIRETPAANLERAYNECSQVLWAGLPRHVKARQEFAQVTIILRDLRAEADPWAAVVDAMSKLLGWSQAARAHAAQAVRVAILSERTG